MERFERFWFSVSTVPLEKEFSVHCSAFQVLENGSDGSGSETVSGKTVPTVPVSGSGSVPEPSCKLVFKVAVVSMELFMLKILRFYQSKVKRAALSMKPNQFSYAPSAWKRRVGRE